MKRRKLLIPPTLREGFIIQGHNDMALTSAYGRQLVRFIAFSMAAFRDGGPGSLPGERRGVDGLRFYPFCPLTSLQAATRQTARPRSLSWEYKQRADDRASTMSPPRPLVSSIATPSGTLAPQIFSSPSLHFRFTLHVSSIFLDVRPRSVLLSLSRSVALCAVETGRGPPRDLNSSLPAPFPEFSSVKSAPLLHPSPPHRPPRDDS